MRSGGLSARRGRRARMGGLLGAASLIGSVSLMGPSPSGLGAQSTETGPDHDPERTVQRDGQAQAAQARAFFQDLLEDPILDRLVRDAIEANPDLRAVQAGIEGAHADRFRTTLDLVPAVTASGAYTRQRISSASFPGLSGTLPDQSFWEAGVQMAWDVDVFGRTRRSLEGRSALVGAARHDVQDAQVLLTAEVASTYFLLRGAQDRLAVAWRNAENQERTLSLTVERLEAGRGTALDTERARAQLSSTRAAIPTLEASVTAAEHRLAVLMGRDPGTLGDALGGGAAPLALPERLNVPAFETLVPHRPDVLGAERRLAASGSFVASAKTGYLPRISIQGAAGYTATDLDAFGSSGTPRYVVGPVISWPLLDLGRVKADVDGAQARQAEARARYDAAVLRAHEDLETSVVVYTRARERLRNLEDAAAASGRATELARLRFEEGAGDFLEVLDSERRLLEAEDLLSMGRTEATTALVSVYRASGGAWSEGT